MIKTTLDERIEKAQKKFYTSDLGYVRAGAIHSLIHLLSEVYTGEGHLDHLEKHYVSLLWKEIKYLCDIHCSDYYPLEDEDSFASLFTNALENALTNEF